MQIKIGVLAVQGGFVEHIKLLEKLDVECIEIRKKADFKENDFDGLILPGGESTVIGKLIRELELFDEIKALVQKGLPVFGTCAGMILLSKVILDEYFVHLGVLDITVQRNAFGNQSGSFDTFGYFDGIGEIPMRFIRAPYIVNVSNDTKILASLDNHIIAARQKNIIVTSFHPELTSDTRVHEYFIDIIKAYKSNTD